MVNMEKTMISASAIASHTESHKNGGSAEDEEREKTECLSGFIFLCNQRTKLECYQYRVFGLPLGQKQVVEDIKSGFKLFLFDFELKLLYGVYEATSTGNLNLEPAAFGGRYPAQVKFKIFKECLPIPESSLRYVIKENYTGSKFKQELSGEQVTKLISSFRPLAAPLCQPALQSLANIHQHGAMPPSLLENQPKLTVRPPMMEVPYISGMQYSHIQPLAEARPVLNFNYPEHGSQRSASYRDNIHLTVDHRSLPAANSYVAYPKQPMLANEVAFPHQDPSYSRYGTLDSASHHDQVTSFESYLRSQRRAPHDEVAILGRRYHQSPLQREALPQDNVASYNSNSTATDQYTPSVLQTQQPFASYHLQGRHYQDGIAHAAYFPVQKEASHEHNVTPYNFNLTDIAQYAASVLQTQAPVSYDQSSLQGTQCQNSEVAYSSDPAAPVQYAASSSQTQAPVSYDQSSLQGTQYQTSAVAYSSDPAAPVQYATAVSQSQVQAAYQDNVAPYNYDPTVPVQYSSIWQPQVHAMYYPQQSEYVHQVNTAAAYPPVAQPEVVPHASAPVASYFPYPAAEQH